MSSRRFALQRLNLKADLESDSSPESSSPGLIFRVLTKAKPTATTTLSVPVSSRRTPVFPSVTVTGPQRETAPLQVQVKQKQRSHRAAEERGESTAAQVPPQKISFGFKIIQSQRRRDLGAS